MSLDNLEVSGLQWRKARRSIGNGACVEVAVAPASGRIGIRDSTDRNGPVIRYTERSWRAFVASAKEAADSRRIGCYVPVVTMPPQAVN